MTGHSAPLVGEIVIHKFLAGALETVVALFQGEQRRIADDDGGVCAVQHGVQVSSQGQERNLRIAPHVKEDARINQRGAAGGVRSHRSHCGQRLRGAADQQQRAHSVLGGNGAAGQYAQIGIDGQRGDRNQADVRPSRGQAIGAFGRRHPLNAIAAAKFCVERRVFEVPHKGGRVQKADRGDAQTRILLVFHVLRVPTPGIRASVSKNTASRLRPIPI